MNQIIKDFGKGLGQLGQETAEKLVETTGKIAESIITAQELLGDIKPMSDEEMVKKKAEDEKKKQEEMNKLRHGEQARNVGDEIERIRKQKEKEEEEREKYFEQIKEKQEQERQIQQENMNMEMMAPKKHQKDKGGNKHKTQQPDQSQMSQTAEFKVKPN